MKIFLSLLVLALIPLNASSFMIMGRVYEKDAHPKKLLYRLKRTLSKKGEKAQIHRVYQDLKGKIVVEESFSLKNDQLIRYQIKMLQTQEEGTVQLKEKELNFTWQDSKGRVTQDSEKFTPKMVVTDQIVSRIRRNWTPLLEGGTFSLRVIVPYRKETVGFRFSLEKEFQQNGKKMIIIKMKPSSIFISVLVDPIYFTFEKSQRRRLLKVLGRTTPKIKHDGNWEDLDAEIVYDYPTTQSSLEVLKK